MPPPIQITKVSIKQETDILLARQRCRQICDFLGFSSGDCTRITTALSEVARNAYEYGGGGTVAFTVDGQELDRQGLVVTVIDQGRGIADVARVLAPGFKSSTGMGVGLKGSRALMDRFAVTSSPGAGTKVVMAKALPWSSTRFGLAQATQLVGALAKVSQSTPMGELQVQNQALLAALREITERQAEIGRLSDIAKEAQQVAERSLAIRQRFMALTTHELRTPLNAIMGYLDLLDFELEPTLSETQKHYFARLKGATQHLASITNDFLEMAQNDAGRLTVDCQLCVALTVMREALAYVAPQAAMRHVVLRRTESTEQMMYIGDVNRVRQVLINVLGNAVSFTPSGGTVELIAERRTQALPGSSLLGGPWCSLRVEDTGPGIPDDKIAQVFEPFAQVSSDGQIARKSTGLGLTVSRQLALLMGGDLTAASNSSGAVFTLWLSEGKAPETTRA